MNIPKTVTINDFLTIEEICQARRLRSAKEICTQIIEPAIDRINRALGQENSPMYLAYAIEYVISTEASTSGQEDIPSDAHI